MLLTEGRANLGHVPRNIVHVGTLERSKSRPTKICLRHGGVHPERALKRQSASRRGTMPRHHCKRGGLGMHPDHKGRSHVHRTGDEVRMGNSLGRQEISPTFPAHSEQGQVSQQLRGTSDRPGRLIGFMRLCYISDRKDTTHQPPSKEKDPTAAARTSWDSGSCTGRHGTDRLAHRSTAVEAGVMASRATASCRNAP
jgi:hypothetical protein